MRKSEPRKSKAKESKIRKIELKKKWIHDIIALSESKSYKQQKP